MFDSLIGNDEVKDAIRRFIAARRIPNALLFAGPEGVGKKRFALELAKSIICREPKEFEPCGKCIACRRAGVFAIPDADAKGEEYDTVFFSEHPDVGMVIPFNRILRVGSIRALESEANFRPFEAPARIFIIDDAHKMNEASSNALLKTLEEPPSTSHIFLISSKPDALLPTIRSRSQVLRFAPVAIDKIEHLLLTTHEYSQDDARLIAASSSGSVASVVSIDVEEFRNRREAALEILRSAILDRDLVALLKKAEIVADTKNKSGFEDFLEILQMLIHGIWSAHIEKRSSQTFLEIEELAEAADTDLLISWLQDIEEIRSALAVNINKKIAADALLVGMVAG